jgi:hypothetical protein
MEYKLVNYIGDPAGRVHHHFPVLLHSSDVWERAKVTQFQELEGKGTQKKKLLNIVIILKPDSLCQIFFKLLKHSIALVCLLLLANL